MMANDDKRNDLDSVPGAGGAHSLSEEHVRELRSEIFQLISDARTNIASRRALSAAVLKCEWAGQSDDGRKHKELLGKDPIPFDCASDMRIRLAEQIVNEKAAVLQTAVDRMTFEGISSQGAGVALDALALFGYVKKNHLGDAWKLLWRKLFFWVLADAPAAAVVGVFWDERFTLREREVSAEQLLAMALENAAETFEGVGEGEAPQAADVADGVMRLLTDPAALDELAGWLSNVLPAGTSEKTCKRAARDLQRHGTARVPVPEVVSSGPVVQSLRLFDDVFIPMNTRNIQESRFVVVREWVTSVELRERVATRGYAREWVDAVLEKTGGLTYLPFDDMGSVWSSFADVLAWSHGAGNVRNKGYYEVLTVYQRASNEDGVPGIYISTMSGGVDTLARDRELLEYAHGRYPFVLFQYEAHSSHVWDSRSIPELANTDQYATKILNDSFNDHTMLSTVPPVKMSASRPDYNISLAPAAVIREMRVNEVDWMKPPPYPQSNDKHRADIKARVDEFFGRFSNTVPPELTQLLMQNMVDDQLPGVGEVVVQVLQLCGQFMDTGTVSTVLGVSEQDAQAFLQAISTRLLVQVSFDTRMLNMEWLKRIGELVGTYLLNWDTEATVDRGRVVRWMAERIDPTLARTVLRPVDEAAQRELDDEDANLAKIVAGVEPPMMEAGQNFRARLGRLTENLQRNPEILPALSGNSRAILEARFKHLQGMVQQEENAQIGRQMAKPALPAVGGN